METHAELQYEVLHQDGDVKFLLVSTLTSSIDWITQLVVSPGDRIFASSSKDGSVALWKKELTNHEGASSWKSVWKKGTFNVGHVKAVTDLSMVGLGSRFMSSSMDRSMILWDVATGKAIKQYKNVHRLGVRSVCLSNDGHKVMTGSCDRDIQMRDLRYERQLLRLRNAHHDWVERVRLNPAFDSKYFLSCGGMQVKIWDMRTAAKNKSADVEQFALHSIGKLSNYGRTVEYGNDGIHMASGGESAFVKIWSIENGPAKTPQYLQVDCDNSSVTCTKFSFDLVYLATTQGNKVYISIKSNRHLVKIQIKAGVNSKQKIQATSVAWSHDGKNLFVGLSDGTIGVFEFSFDNAMEVDQ